MSVSISVITAVRNGAATLPVLMESLCAQTWPQVEWVVQDACSTDGTCDLIQAWNTRLPSLALVSESDGGIYDAWNRAVSRAQGEWLLFVGADDQLCAPDALAQVASVLKDVPLETQYLATGLIFVLPDGSAIEAQLPVGDPVARLPVEMPLPHPSLFHRRSLFAAQRFDPALRIAGDYDFLARTLTRTNWRMAPVCTTKMCVGGVSGSLGTLFSSECEMLRCSRRAFPQAARHKLYARILRSLLVRAVLRVGGESPARMLADIFRLLQGKPRLWTRLPNA